MAPASSSQGTRPDDTFHVEITVRYQGLKATQYFSKFTPESNDVFRSDLLTLKIPLPKVENTNLITHGSVGCFWPDCIKNSTLHKHIIGKANNPERVKEWKDALAALSISSFLVKERRSSSSFKSKLKRPNPFPEDDGPRKMVKPPAANRPPVRPRMRGPMVVTHSIPSVGFGIANKVPNVSRAYREVEEPGEQAQSQAGASTQSAAVTAESPATLPRTRFGTRFGPAVVIKSEPIDVDLPPSPVVDTSIPDVKPAWNGATPTWPRAVRERDLHFQGMATRSRTHPQPSESSTIAAKLTTPLRKIDIVASPSQGVVHPVSETEPRRQTRLSTSLANGNATPSARVLKLPVDPTHESPTIPQLPEWVLSRPPDSALRKNSTVGGLPTPPSSSLLRTQSLPNPPIKTEPLTIRIPARPRPSAAKETQSIPMVLTAATAQPPSPPPSSHPVAESEPKPPTPKRPQKGIPLSRAAKDAPIIQRLNRELWEVRWQAAANAAREETIIKDLKAVNAAFIPEPAKAAEHEEVAALKAHVVRLEEELKTERTLRHEAEGAIEDIKQECRAPFVVPSLVDAFVQISKLSTRSIQLSMEERESAMDVSPPDAAIPVTQVPA